MKKMINLSIALIGFTAMASQIIYMRELLVVFYGNELSISFILASWLIAGAIGSAVLGRFVGMIRKKIEAFSLCQVFLGIMLPVSLVAARIIKPALHVNPGEIIPLFPVMILSFIILAPVCVTLGFMFSLACHIQSEDHFTSRPETAIGNVYILEAAGSIVGGALTSIILIRFFSALYITTIFASLNFVSAFLVIASPVVRRDEAISKKGLLRRFAPRNGYLTISIFFLVIVTIFVLWPSGWMDSLNKYSLKKQWQGCDIIASKNSIYGNIAIAKRGEDYSFFDNGLHLYTVPDKKNSEEAVHLALLEHPDPKYILLIGGGVGGLAEEILKEPVRRVDYVELDPLMISMSRECLPDSYYKVLKDPRVSIKNTDGRFFVKTTKDKYDCVVIDVGDPYTAQLNRYYTVEFFKEIKDILKKGGILSFSLSSSDSYISKSLSEFLSSAYFTVKDVFPEVLIIPGERAYFISSEEKGCLTYDYKILEERTRERRMDTQYVREYYFSYKLSKEKISYIEGVIKNRRETKINRDLQPVLYYYGLIFWTTLFRDSAFSASLKSINEHIIWQAIGVFIIFLAVFSFLRKRSFKRAALMAVMAGGFSSMAFQIIILMSFQFLYGYLFYKLGIILTAFMFGLLIGAKFAVKIIEKIGRPRSFLIAVQGDFFLFSLILPVILLKFGSNIMFPVASVIAGFIGGSQFPLANSVLLKGGSGTGTIGGLNYGVDLLGSFLGALLTGIFLIPILGIPKTCVAIAIINLAILALLALNVSIEE